MFIPLNVVMQDIDEDEENLGRKAQKVTVELMVNIDNICGFNESDNGNTTLRMSSGDYEAIIEYKKLKFIIEELANREQEGDDLLISGNN